LAGIFKLSSFALLNQPLSTFLFLPFSLPTFDILSSQVFGPYKGTIVNPNDEAADNGLCWELKDFNEKVIGCINPGSNPESEKNWLAFVNCPNRKGYSPINTNLHRAAD